MLKKGKPKFNHHEMAILSMMRRRKYHPYTTNEIAKNLGMSWHTAEETLKKLFKRGYVKKGKKRDGRTIRWKLISAYERRSI